MENQKKESYKPKTLQRKPYPRKAVTGKVRFSYANVWEPRSVNGGEEKYSVSLIIPKSETNTLCSIKAAIEAAVQEGKSRLGVRIPEEFSLSELKLSELKLPLRDGDVEYPDDEAYRDSFFLNAASKDKPQIVDRDMKPITCQGDFYSGCYGRASITFYPFNIEGNKGIGCGLGNLQKLTEGEPLTGHSSAEDDFAEEDDFDFLG